MKSASALVIFVLSALIGINFCENVGNSPTPIIAPNTTTSTTPAPKTSTTPAPKTSTTPAPITSTTPAPNPGSDFFNGTVIDKVSSYTCLRYEFGVHFVIKYTTIQGKSAEALVSLAPNSEPNYPAETCNSTKETFALVNSGSKSPISNFELTFARNDNSVYLESIILNVTYDNTSFPNTNSSGSFQVFNLTNFNPNFNVEKSHSYFCANVTLPKEENNLKVVFSSIKIQAFMDKSKNGEFSSEHNCQNEINDVVPIAVGAALTGLVVIVMIAYFIGRRRSRRLAYQSV